MAGPSQFWVAGRNVPEPNEDTLRIAPVFQYLPQQFKDSTWTAEETKCLTEALLKAAQAWFHGSLCLQDRHMRARNAPECISCLALAALMEKKTCMPTVDLKDLDAVRICWSAEAEDCC